MKKQPTNPGSSGNLEDIKTVCVCVVNAGVLYAPLHRGLICKLLSRKQDDKPSENQGTEESIASIKRYFGYFWAMSFREQPVR